MKTILVGLEKSLLGFKLKQCPSIWTLKGLGDYVNGCSQAGINGKWVPARPLGAVGIVARIKAAWLVFTGKADAVTWPEDQ